MKSEQAKNVLEFIKYVDANPAKWREGATRKTTDESVLKSHWLRAKDLNQMAPATTKRENSEMGCDSLNPLETLGEPSEASAPLA